MPTNWHSTTHEEERSRSHHRSNGAHAVREGRRGLTRRQCLWNASRPQHEEDHTNDAKANAEKLVEQRGGCVTGHCWCGLSHTGDHFSSLINRRF